MKPIGPYSPVVQAGELLFVSGQISSDLSLPVAEQTKQSLENLRSVLRSAGADLSQVVKTTVFLKNMTDFEVMNAVYASYFTQNPPARSTIEIARLPKDALIEIEAVVYNPQKASNS